MKIKQSINVSRDGCVNFVYQDAKLTVGTEHVGIFK